MMDSIFLQPKTIDYMKKYSLISLLTLVLACNQKPISPHGSNAGPGSTTVSLVIDVTDPRSYLPPPDAVLAQYQCKQNPDAECIFRLRAITDMRLSAIQSLRLPDALSGDFKNKDDDSQFRARGILAFYNSVRSMLHKLYAQFDSIRTLKNSECFRIIANELSFLSQSKSTRRILLVASDLLEKSDLLDSYREDISNSQKVAHKLDSAGLLPRSLTGISVVFVFSPRNRLEDQQFYALSEAYKALMEQKGAKVSIQANL
jgi:hypothetical protein